MCRPQLGTSGYLSCFLASLLAAMIAEGWKSLGGLFLSLALALIFYPKALVVLRKPAFWLFSTLLIVTSGLWASAADVSLGPVAFSGQGLALGAQMTVRTAAILIAMQGLAVSVSPGELAGLLEKTGLKGLGFTFGVAVNILPVLERSASNTWDTLRMRGGLRRNRWRTFKLAAVTVIAGALRRVDEIAVAAEVRGFSPEKSRPMKTRHSSLDVPVALFLLILLLVFALE